MNYTAKQLEAWMRLEPKCRIGAPKDGDARIAIGAGYEIPLEIFVPIKASQIVGDV